MSDVRLEDAQRDARREAAPFVFCAVVVDVLLGANSSWHDWQLFSGDDWWVWLVLAIPAAVLGFVFLLGLGRFGLSSEHRRKAAVTLLGLLAISNLVGIGLVLGTLLSGSTDPTGAQLLASAAVVLIVNVITFGRFWELDSGGPVRRALSDRRHAPDFQFPQDENPAHGTIGSGAERLSLYRRHELDRVQPDRCDAADAPSEAVHGYRVVDRGRDRIDRRRSRGQHPGSGARRARRAARGASECLHTTLYVRHSGFPDPSASMVSPRNLPKGDGTMRSTKVRLLFATVVALALMVGVGTAIAATGGGDLKQEAAWITSRNELPRDAAIAKSLGTTTAKLNAAIKAAAVARIDAALAADEITATEAETLKDALDDGSLPAMHLATVAGVAAQLDTTVAKLNAAYSDSQKARAKARVDEALTAGNITEKYATELKAQIDAATFPGFGAGGMGHHGGPGGRGGPGPGFGPDLGLAPPAAGSSSSSSSTTTSTSAALVFA